MTSIYQTFADLLTTYVFGGSIASGSWAELVVTLLSTIACLFVIAVPFIVVYKGICLIFGR